MFKRSLLIIPIFLNLTFLVLKRPGFCWVPRAWTFARGTAQAQWLVISDNLCISRIFHTRWYPGCCSFFKLSGKTISGSWGVFLSSKSKPFLSHSIDHYCTSHNELGKWFYSSSNDSPFKHLLRWFLWCLFFGCFSLPFSNAFCSWNGTLQWT